jgi:hypothetical protein
MKHGDHAIAPSYNAQTGVELGNKIVGAAHPIKRRIGFPMTGAQVASLRCLMPLPINYGDVAQPNLK